MGIIGDGMEILGLINKAQNADLYRQVGEWIDKVAELQKQNDELRTEVKDLRDKLRFKGVIERINGHVFIQGDDEEVCPRCAEVDLRPVHLIPHRSKFPPYQKAFCPSCEREFQHNLPYSRGIAAGLRTAPSVL
jgi:hypothetical protein